MFYGYRWVDDPALGLFGTTDMGWTSCGGRGDDCRWKFNGPPKACIPPPPPMEQHVREAGLFHISAQGLAGAHQTPQLLLTWGAHLVPSNPEEGNWGSTSNLCVVVPSHTYTYTYLYKCTVPDNLTPHPLQFLLCRYNLSQLSWFSRFYFLFSVPLSLPLHSPGSQLGLNTHRRVVRTNINCSAWEDWVGSLFKCVIWEPWKHMLKILLKALVLNQMIALLSLLLAVTMSVSLSTSVCVYVYILFYSSVCVAQQQQHFCI